MKVFRGIIFYLVMLESCFYIFSTLSTAGYRIQQVSPTKVAVINHHIPSLNLSENYQTGFLYHSLICIFLALLWNNLWTEAFQKSHWPWKNSNTWTIFVKVFFNQIKHVSNYQPGFLNLFWKWDQYVHLRQEAARFLYWINLFNDLFSFATFSSNIAVWRGFICV